MVIALAKTGRLKISKNTVIKTHQTNKLKQISFIRFAFILSIVVIKLIDPKIELIPAKWRLKIPKITLYPGCPSVLNGGYKVQDVPIPNSTKLLKINKIREVGNNQKEREFTRG